MLSVRFHRLLLSLLLVAVLGGSLFPSPATAHGTAIRVPNFPSVKQWYSLSCEYAAAAAVKLYWGTLVSQNDFIREVPP